MYWVECNPKDPVFSLFSDRNQELIFIWKTIFCEKTNVHIMAPNPNEFLKWNLMEYIMHLYIQLYLNIKKLIINK